jgi:hypothetical protein
MIKYPESRSHMLLLGPPGSGKTTAAQSFAIALHGKQMNKFASLLFLNSSDERSLETMRQKIYPFVESRMQSLFFTDGKAPPKVLIFDEAETNAHFAPFYKDPPKMWSLYSFVIPFRTFTRKSLTSFLFYPSIRQLARSSRIS